MVKDAEDHGCLPLDTRETVLLGSPILRTMAILSPRIRHVCFALLCSVSPQQELLVPGLLGGPGQVVQHLPFLLEHMLFGFVLFQALLSVLVF